MNKADKLHTKKRIIRKNQTLDRIKIELAVERAFANYGFIEVQGENRNYIRLDHGHFSINKNGVLTTPKRNLCDLKDIFYRLSIKYKNVNIDHISFQFR